MWRAHDNLIGIALLVLGAPYRINFKMEHQDDFPLPLISTKIRRPSGNYYFQISFFAAGNLFAACKLF